jgi:four helix bundle protein
MRFRIARKEAKETLYWLEVLKVSSNSHFVEIDDKIRESNELLKILSAIINKLDK